MIKFKYGPNAIAATAAATTPVVKAAFAANPNALNSVFDLPAFMRPQPISEEEMLAVRYGGGADYDIAPKKAPGKK